MPRVRDWLELISMPPRRRYGDGRQGSQEVGRRDDVDVRLPGAQRTIFRDARGTALSDIFFFCTARASQVKTSERRLGTSRFCRAHRGRVRASGVDEAGEIFGDAPHSAARVQIACRAGRGSGHGKGAEQKSPPVRPPRRAASCVEGVPEPVTLFGLVRASGGAGRSGARNITPLDRPQR